MRVALISTSRSDRGHYAPLERLLRADARFELDNPELDAAVVLGDRVEMLQAAVNLVERRVPLLHIHGGEHTYGSLDERWRWAISAIADMHCVAHDEAARELLRWYGNVHRTGAPGLDGITERKRLAFPHRLLVLYNPVIDRETTQREHQAIVAGIGAHTPQMVLRGLEQSRWFRCNGERYSEVLGVGDEVDADTFRDELAGAQVIVGNSSAGIIEAPSLGTWAVNVGDRQRGRMRAGNVIDVPAEPAAINAAILDALSRPRFSGPNPYGDGHASERIRDVLLTMA